MKYFGVEITMGKFYRPLILASLALMLFLFSAPQPAQAFMTVQWSYVANQQYGTLEAMGLALNGKLYFFGGYDALRPNDWVPTNRAYVYDPATNQWTAIANMPYAATHAGTTTDGTYIYIAGGYPMNSTGSRQNFASTNVVRYDPVSNTYTSLPSLPQARGAGVMIYANGELHYMGGANSSRVDEATHYVISITNGDTAWHTEAAVPNGTNHPGAVALNGKIYYFGGNHFMDTNSTPQNDSFVYDPVSDQWTQLADLPFGVNHIASATLAINGQIVIIGGERNYGNSTDRITAYNPATNTWSELDPFPARRHSGVAGVIGDYIYYTTGNGGNPGTSATLRGLITLVEEDGADIEIEKTNLSGNIVPGTNATFEIVVTNSGFVPLTDIVVSDPLTPDCNSTLELDMGSSASYTCTAFNVMQAFTNTINVTGQGTSTTVTDSDTATVGLILPSIGINISGNGPVYAGQNAVFTVTVTNNGQLALSNVTVDADLNQCDRTIGTLAVGSLSTYTCSIPTTAPDVTANMTARGSFLTFNATDSESRTIVVNVPSVLIDVSPNTQTIPFNSPAGFNVTVTNNGEVALTQITVSAPTVADCDRVFTNFAVSQTTTYSCGSGNRNLSFTVTFQAVATYSPGTAPVTNSESVSVTVNPPALPAQPTGLNATGNFQVPPVNPTFQWTHGTDIAWYRLYVTGAGGILLDAWYEVGVSITCTSTCSINPNLNLSVNGEYSWWVLGWNLQGNGPWSNTATFTIAIPGPVTPIGLTTLGSLTTAPVVPSFRWNRDANAQWYEVYISGPNGLILNQWYQVDTANITCNPNTCTISPNMPFSNGDYSWWVRGWNSVGYSAWSATANFTVSIPAPATPTGLVVNGDLTAPSIPTFSWNNDPNSQWYELYISGASGLILDQWYQVGGAGITCAGATCTASPNLSLMAGTYNWWVLGWNSAVGNGAWSAMATFTVAQGNVVPTNLTVLNNTGAPATPSFQFNAVNGATWYELYISNASGVVLDTWYQVGGAGIVCNTGVCTISPNLALPAGTYSWWLRGWNASQGNLPWTNPVATFTVSP